MPIKDFRIDAYEPINPGKVKAYGPGLSHGTVDKSADFVIDTRGAGNGALNLTVDGPCEARIECKDNQDGTCHVSYLPTMAGNYMINILYQSERSETKESVIIIDHNDLALAFTFVFTSTTYKMFCF